MILNVHETDAGIPASVSHVLWSDGAAAFKG
jgi:hypothetical protein